MSLYTTFHPYLGITLRNELQGSLSSIPSALRIWGVGFSGEDDISFSHSSCFLSTVVSNNRSHYRLSSSTNPKVLECSYLASIFVVSQMYFLSRLYQMGFQSTLLLVSCNIVAVVYSRLLSASEGSPLLSSISTKSLFLVMSLVYSVLSFFTSVFSVLFPGLLSAFWRSVDAIFSASSRVVT